ncbi:hypothetical protein FFWV33_17155 [Flavobacterium faecale]|uniref:Glycosyltransferase 2-like domain-containing protein n=1 Tax=Flavobacterium faecale TaxID=1355330 RepID=A0A2S1LHA5_9FLAO|nr:hypothetical protein [Flavobacterium faecale]AWG23133.1 hypothetical protein FFWV33_17155 [Flavobacterium faecale]
MKIAACVILYHPKEKDLHNILSYLPHVDRLYVYDNTENAETILPFEDNDKVLYVSDNQNKGLSVRLNYACNLALEEGFDFLLTMDQDSYFIPENFKQYLINIQEYALLHEVGSFGLDYSTEAKVVQPAKVVPQETNLLITSGSVLNLRNYQEIGGFDEKLFIDGVDYDFSFSTMKAGYKNIIFKNNYFNHSFGEKTKVASIKTLFLIKKEKQLHSPIRIYYIKRNLLYLQDKFGDVFPELVQKMSKRYASQIESNLLYSRKFFPILKFISKAKKDFKAGKMGKIEL